MNNKKVAVLICSCDYYSDCWEPIMCSFRKYWPDCEYDVLIVSNHKDVTVQGAKVILVGDHKGWASDTLKTVTMTDYDYYIYFQEDYWLNKRVDNEAIKAHVQHCIENHVDYLKIEPDRPKCDQYRIGESDYCKNPLNKRYTMDSEVLHSTVIRSKGITMIPANGIQRGKWTPAGVVFLRENGFDELLKTRKTQNKFYSWCYYKLPGKGILRYPKLAFLRLLRWLKIN